MTWDEGIKLEILAPVVRDEKGSHKEILEDLGRSKKN